MAANVFASGSASDTITFDKAVNYLNVFVDSGVTFSLSLDKGANFITLPSGFHSFVIGSVKEVRVQSDGVWQLIGVQA
jgi:hypothetical protein